LDPIPASKVHSHRLEIAELENHSSFDIKRLDFRNQLRPLMLGVNSFRVRAKYSNLFTL